MPTNTFLALTIGPIYKTMKMARKTREFWGASMLFSLLAKSICDQLIKLGIQDDNFLVPTKNVFKRKIENVGLYLDRIICEVPDESYINMIDSALLDPALVTLATVLNKVDAVNITVDELKKYFNIYATCLTIDDPKILNVISPPLNVMELYNQNESESSAIDLKIKTFIENVNTEYDNDSMIVASNFLKEYYNIADINGNIRIPSILEISTIGLKDKVPKDSDNTYKKILKAIHSPKPDEQKIIPHLKDSFKDDFRNFHKYFCVIQADGDKLGNTLMNADSDEIKLISSDLIQWGEEAMSKLIDYGALPIYIGGDDLLCFAPVNNGKNTIIDLVCDLNKSYNEMPNLKGKSTLSIAVKCTYYKSPMYESYSDTFEMLSQSKNHKSGIDKVANSCNIQLDKHSGQPQQFLFRFDTEYGSLIKPILDTMNFDSNKKSFLNSVMYKLRANEELMHVIHSDQDRLWAFFQNNFDEASEKKKDTPQYKYLEAVKKGLFILFEKHKSQKDNKKEHYLATIEMYSIIKTIRFIKGLDDDKEG